MPRVVAAGGHPLQTLMEITGGDEKEKMEERSLKKTLINTCKDTCPTIQLLLGVMNGTGI